MVSWFSFYFEHWRVFRAENTPNEHHLASAAHEAFLTVKNKNDILKWNEEYGSVPGVFLMAHNKVGRDGKRKIDAVHHVSLIHGSGGGEDDYLVGLVQLGGGSLMSSCLVKDVVADLVPAATKRTGTRGGIGSGKDGTVYVPPLGRLIDEPDGLFGKGFVPSVGEDCMTCEDIASRPSVVFVPFFIWIVICTGTNPNQSGVARRQGRVAMDDESDDSNDDNEPILKTSGHEEDILIDKANSPLNLARSLWKRMGVLREEDYDMFTIYHGVAQNLLDFLWAANNNLTPGIRLKSTEGDLEAMKQTKECLEDFLKFAQYGVLAPGSRHHQDDANHKQASSPQQEEEDSVVQVEGQQKPANTDEPARQYQPRLPPPSPKVAARPTGSPPASMTDIAEDGPAWMKVFMKGLAGTLAEVGSAIREAAQVNRSAREKEDDKKKATSKWLPDSMFVMRILSAENGWATPGMPELNQFATKLFDMKLLQAIHFIRAKSKDDGWSGCILKSGLSEFLKRGPIAEDINEAPSGFSVLFFHHSAYSEGDDESHAMQALREAYGDGEMPDDLVKAFSKLHIFVPTCTFRAGEQIKAAIQFLETVCGEKTIATAGYIHGLRMLEDHRRLFEREADKDKLFLFNYLYLLDRMFQRFCQEIRECSQEQDPVLTLHDILKGDQWMREMINQAMEPLIIFGKELGLRPPLKLQERSSLAGLIDMSQIGKGNPNKRPAEHQDGGGKAGGKYARRKLGGDAHPDWWTELGNEDLVQEWAIPQSKKFGDYFGPHKKENVVGLPFVQHHKTKRPAPICLKYQLGNGVKCKRGADCALAHIRPRDLASNEYQQITDHLKRVYNTGLSS